MRYFLRLRSLPPLGPEAGLPIRAGPAPFEAEVIGVLGALVDLGARDAAARRRAVAVVAIAAGAEEEQLSAPPAQDQAQGVHRRSRPPKGAAGTEKLDRPGPS